MAKPPFIHPSRRYRLYFDETGNGDLRAYEKDPNQRYLSVTGIVMPQEVHDGPFTAALNALKANVFGSDQAPTIILHRREIMRREGPFSVLKDDDLRHQFNEQLIGLVGRLYGPALTISIDKQEHAEKYSTWHFSPYHYVLTCLVERFVRWLDDHNCIGDVMGEARPAKHDAQLRRSFRRFYDHGTNVPVAMIQTRLTSREIRLEPKNSNVAALQACDMLAHPCHRAYKFERLRIPQPDDYGARMAALVKHIYRKSIFTERIEGYGRKWLP